MGGKFNRYVVPADRNIRMMLLRFGNVGYLVHEGHRLLEIDEGVEMADFFIVEHFPRRFQFRYVRRDLIGSKRWRAAFASYALLLRQIHIINC